MKCVLKVIVHCQASSVVCRLNTYIYNDAEVINKIQVCFKSFLNLHFKKPLGGVSFNQY